MKWIFIFLSFLLSHSVTCQVHVPQVSQVKVIADGINNKGEWRRANTIQLGKEFTIYLMADSVWVYLAIFSNGQASHYTDLYLLSALLVNLHASMQLGERQLPLDGTWNDETPAWSWGNNKNWIANSVNYKSNASESAPFLEQGNPISRTRI